MNRKASKPASSPKKASKKAAAAKSRPKAQAAKKAPAGKAAGKAAKKSGPPADLDAYLAPLPPDVKAALQKLRKSIRAAAPTAEEYITYGVPAFKYLGRPLVGLGAAKSHVGFYPMSGAAIKAHAAELKAYDTSPGTIRIPLDRPMPDALVKKLVRARMADILARGSR